jgi:REP element-mobilizing transposase RayT
LIEGDAKRESAEKRQMDQGPYDMDRSRRETVLAALVERCSANHWSLLAAHVRTNHVHIVVDADVSPERVMNDLKSYASRCLNKLGLETADRKRWARHGSTRWLWKRESVSAAIRYVVEGQGEPMAVVEAIDFME